MMPTDANGRILALHDHFTVECEVIAVQRDAIAARPVDGSGQVQPPFPVMARLCKKVVAEKEGSGT